MCAGHGIVPAGASPVTGIYRQVKRTALRIMRKNCLQRRKYRDILKTQVVRIAPANNLPLPPELSFGSDTSNLKTQCDHSTPSFYNSIHSTSIIEPSEAVWRLNFTFMRHSTGAGFCSRLQKDILSSTCASCRCWEDTGRQAGRLPSAHIDCARSTLPQGPGAHVLSA
jgi:hypothetical protein